MKIAVIYLAIAFFTLFPLLAQQQNAAADQGAVHLEQLNRGDDHLLAPAQNPGVHSLGFGYKEVMEQLRTLAHTDRENYVQVVQQGDNNVAHVEQNGKNNRALVEQMGNNNIFFSTQTEGEENLIHVLQTGHYNELYQIMSGSNMQIQVVQEGSYHELIHIENPGSGPAPNYQVHQRGDGMQIIIEHGMRGF